MLMMMIIIIAIRQVNGIVQIRFHNQPSYLQILSAQTYQILVLLDNSLILLDLQPYLTGQALVPLMNWRYPIQLPLIGKVCQPQPALQCQQVPQRQ